MSAAPDGEPQCHDEQRAQLYATLEARRQSSSVAAADVVRQQRQRTAWGERRSDGANPTWDGMLAGLRAGLACIACQFTDLRIAACLASLPNLLPDYCPF